MLTVGLDEVGRGCWAGPLVAGAVVLIKPIAGLKDSKQLTKSQRQKLAVIIEQQAEAFGLGWVTSAEIDSIGLTEATRQAMKRALEAVKTECQEIIIDGNYNFLADDPRSKAIIDADNLIPSVSAASIIAKVARDKFMSQQAKNFPQYFFDQHVGYGTKLHLDMLKRYGVCELHRLSFKPIAKLMGTT